MSQDDDKTTGNTVADDDTDQVYERPEVTDYGILTELTLSGHGAQTDSLISAGS